MREIAGKQVYDCLGEIVDPRHTSVLVVDMQNDYCKPGGYFDLHGYGYDVIEAQKMLPKLVTFIDEARKQGVFVAFVQNCYLRSGLLESPAWLYLLWKRGYVKEGVDTPYVLEGTWGQKIVDELKPQPGEPVVNKYRSSAFHNTALDTILKNKGIQSVIVTGTATRSCCEKTAIDACFHDYYTVMLRDCLSPLDGSLKSTGYYDVATSDDVLKEWAASHWNRLGQNEHPLARPQKKRGRQRSSAGISP